MSFSTLVIRGRRVAEIAEEYDIEMFRLPKDIRDDLIEAQQAHIEALACVVIDLGRQVNAKELSTKDTKGHESLWHRVQLYGQWWYTRCWLFCYRIRPRWL